MCSLQPEVAAVAAQGAAAEAAQVGLAAADSAEAKDVEAAATED